MAFPLSFSNGLQSELALTFGVFPVDTPTCWQGMKAEGTY